MRFKKLLVAGLAVMTAAFFAGCGGSDKAASGDTKGVKVGVSMPTKSL